MKAYIYKSVIVRETDDGSMEFKGRRDFDFVGTVIPDTVEFLQARNNTQDSYLMDRDGCAVVVNAYKPVQKIAEEYREEYFRTTGLEID